MNLDEIYDAVKTECKGLCLIYEGCILELVGLRGLNMLKANNLLEDRGVVHGRQMYVLRKR